MKTEHTLRHLLLRHFKIFEGAVPGERFLEVTQSLRVETQGRTSYRVTYRDQGRERELSLPFDSFQFYERGDTRSDQRSLDDNLSNRNDERTLDFAVEVFRVALDSLPTQQEEPLDSYRRVSMAEMAVFAVATAWAAEFDPLGSAALLSLVLSEFASRGRLIASGLFAAVAVTAPPTAALLAASAYGLLQFLDPDSDRRVARIGLCLLAVGVSGLRLGLGDDVPGWGWYAFGGLMLATLVSAFRSFYSSHFRALPLTMPFFCAGLAIDQHVYGASIGLLILVLGRGVQCGRPSLVTHSTRLNLLE